MAFKVFPTIITEDTDLSRVQRNIEITIDPICQNARLDSRIIKSQALINVGVNVINHGLGRTLQGWIIIDKNGPSEFWSGQAFNQNASMTLWLYSSNIVVVSLEVF